MTRLLLITLFLLSSAPAYAEWVKVTEGDERTIYADSSTIRVKGNTVKIWELEDEMTIRAIGGEIVPFWQDARGIRLR